MQVLEGLINIIQSKYVEFSDRVNMIRYSREGRNPTALFVAEFQSLTEEELSLVEACKLGERVK